MTHYTRYPRDDTSAAGETARVAPSVSRLEAAEAALQRQLSHQEREWLNFWTSSLNGYWLLDGFVVDLNDNNRRYTLRAVVYRINRTRGSRGQRQSRLRSINQAGERWQHRIHVPADGRGVAAAATYDTAFEAIYSVRAALISGNLQFVFGNSRDAGAAIRQRLEAPRTPIVAAQVPDAPSVKVTENVSVVTARRGRGLEL